jgi:tyrosine-protein kinase Etk/Wzc
MDETKGFQLFEYLNFIVRRKELLLVVLVGSFVLTYAGVFLFVQDKFEAVSTIIPKEEESAAGLAGGLLKGMKGMSFGLGSKSMSTEMDMYRTIIYSRTMMEDVVRRFDLLATYGIDTTDVAFMEIALKRLRKEIQTTETDESAFQVSVRATTARASAEMTNYIVQRMNDRIIGLRVSRSRESRLFLETRMAEISAQLKVAEDSLRAFQERTGLLEAKSQVQGILEANATLEAQRMAKDLQRGILVQMFDKDAPQVKEVDMQLDVIDRRLARMRTESTPGSALLPLKQLPKTTVEFLRRYREVELNGLLLQYVMPLYEQAKLEEKKDYPILQIIDQAIPPAKRAYPPRLLFALLGSIGVTMVVLVYLGFGEAKEKGMDPRMLALVRDGLKWNWKKVRQS